MSDVGESLSDVGETISDIGQTPSDVGERISDVGGRLSDLFLQNTLCVKTPCGCVALTKQPMAVIALVRCLAP